MRPLHPAERRRSTAILLQAIRCIAMGAAMLTLTSLANADVGIAVLDFELRDLTLAPGGEEELRRTAGLKVDLEKALRARGNYRLAVVASSAQARAAPGVGYLSDHPETAAALADAASVDWMVVGTLTKPTFLFSYLQVRLVRVRDGTVVDDFYVEIKGRQDQVTPKAVKAVAERIDTSVRAQRMP